MAQMQNMIAALQQKMQNNQVTRLQAPAQAPVQAPPRRRRHNTKYCWTHGGCNHTGVDCKQKSAGHIDCTTFNNRQGGSERGCNAQG